MIADTTDVLALLVRRSSAGDGRALAELKQALPDRIRLDELADIARQAQESWAATENGQRRRPTDRLCALKKATVSLTRAGAGPLERLLAGHVALAEARLIDIRYLARQAADDPVTPSNVIHDLARRAKRAEREAAAAQRILQDFQQRLEAGL